MGPCCSAGVAAPWWVSQVKGRLFKDPYRAVIQRFNRTGVRCVVVGMSGINYYARNPAETFATLDYDIFLEPTQSNVKKAVEGLQKMGFQLGTSAGTFKPGELKQLVRYRKTLVATTPEGLMVELILEVSGYPFSEMIKDSATFTVRGVPVRVARLNKLLRSKKMAGRPKDRRFLQRYEDLLRED